MRSFLTIFSLMLLLALPLAWAADAPAAAPAKKGPQVAAFNVPKLTEGTLVKSLVTALNEKPGILSAAPDKEKGHFKVTFDPEKTDAEKILKLITPVAKDATLVGVTPADEKAGKDCAKCPHHKECDKAKKK